jgi:hypothetical protein
MTETPNPSDEAGYGPLEVSFPGGGPGRFSQLLI